MKCIYCNTINTKDSKYCKECGLELEFNQFETMDQEEEKDLQEIKEDNNNYRMIPKKELTFREYQSFKLKTIGIMIAVVLVINAIILIFSAINEVTYEYPISYALFEDSDITYIEITTGFSELVDNKEEPTASLLYNSISPFYIWFLFEEDPDSLTLEELEECKNLFWRLPILASTLRSEMSEDDMYNYQLADGYLTILENQLEEIEDDVLEQIELKKE